MSVRAEESVQTVGAKESPFSDNITPDSMATAFLQFVTHVIAKDWNLTRKQGRRLVGQGERAWWS